MLPGPVFFHELRTFARRRRSFVLRGAIGLFLIYLVVQPARYWIHLGASGWEGQYTAGELAMIGRSLYGSVIWLQAIVILVLTPALVAGAITEDRQRNVLPYLLASPLAGAEIVLGKLAARLINLIVLITLGLPVVSIALFLGGIEPLEVWLAYGLSITTLYLVAAMSIFVSTFSTRLRDAILWAYVIELAWLGVPILEWLLIELGGAWAGALVEARPVSDWITWSSPSKLVVSLSWFTRGPGLIENLLWMMALQIAYGSVLIAWPTLRLRAVERGDRLWSWQRLGVPTQSRPRRLFTRRDCGDDPMLWKECTSTVGGGSIKRTIVMLLLGLVAAVGLGVWVYELGVPAFREVLEHGYGSTARWDGIESLSIGSRVLTGCLYVVVGLILGVVAATGVTAEHEKDTWVSLMVTPLERREIIRGKILGAFWRVRGIIAALLVVWLIGMVCGAIHPLGFLLALVATATYLAFIAGLGTFISLSCKSSARAIGLTVGSLVFFNGGYLFCCVPFLDGRESILAAAGVTPMVVTTVLFSFSEFHDFLNWRSVRDQILFVVTGVLSLGWYGIAARCLLKMCLERVESAFYRRRRDIQTYPVRVSSAGITFLDDDRSDSDGSVQDVSSGDMHALEENDRSTDRNSHS
jgi:ABC-type transport system involved in multi-copper enzyme maturation permease subunit